MIPPRQMVLLCATLTLAKPSCADEESDARAFLARYNQEGPKQERDMNIGYWNFATDITDTTRAAKAKSYLKYLQFKETMRDNASIFDVNKLSADTKRQIKIIKASAMIKDLSKRKTHTRLRGEMEKIYSSAKVNDALIGKNLLLDPHLTDLMANSRNYSVLLTAWREWRAVTGVKIRPLYKEFVNLSNQGARDNGWADLGVWWKSKFEVPNLGQVVEELWLELNPLYLELHAYVRNRLQEQYPQVMTSQPIPAHVLGNMWSESWTNIYSLVEPYRGKPSLDVTANLKKQNYDALRVVKLAESFFESLGLGKLPRSFYDNSMIVRPRNREVECHAYAFDFFVRNSKNERDVRIKQCISITHEDLVTTQRELGHMYYFLEYWNQPYAYRGGANPAFHEALGDTMSLSVDTPKHLVKIKLLDEYTEDSEADINALMKMALRHIAFLPFGFLVDQWRWKVFSGEIKESEYNTQWWELRTKYQGIKPPVSRDETHFDPGAKFHIPANVPFLRYFLSTVLQFQFHKAACEIAGFTGPLHRCSVYQSKAVGTRLRAMLQMGRSKPWPDVLEIFSGSRKMDVNALKEYFKPLRNWLLQKRCVEQYEIGWTGSTKPGYDPCHPPTFLPPRQPSTPGSIPTARAPRTADHTVLALVLVSLLGALVKLMIS